MAGPSADRDSAACRTHPRAPQAEGECGTGLPTGVLLPTESSSTSPRRTPAGVGRWKSTALLLAPGTAVAGAAPVGPGSEVGQASSHREAPLIASDLQVGNTDL
ncbi:hypothetical protein [Actinacidiphila sp. ITFR-21]|uniref:hypothetical protein n=1 Tax=Actinacidiphila sp. ITFR-21 TaxID=3075199 RepID=UPI00288B6E41|nr:hypothetical protein [Streptomyces sp. ITFR-21]WNI14772.1 hypothetical protein RLT57_03950 [Streptomyces sp. ITFR-21]